MNAAFPAQVVVVGAGPAGLNAALAAADLGASVLLVDSAPRLGGQYYRQPPGAAHSLRSFSKLATKLLAHKNIRHLADTTVWAIESTVDERSRVHLQHGAADSPRRTTVVDTAALVLASGAYDRALPFPGWDLPGVYTAGAAQALAKGQHVAVGQRVVVAGTGPFLLPVAQSVTKAGGRVLSVLEANGPSGWLRHPWKLRGELGKLGELAGYVGTMARHRIRYSWHSAVIAAHGTDRVEAVTTARLDRHWRVVPGSERRVEADAVCVGYGFTPQLELAMAAGCRTVRGQDGADQVEVDHWQASSVPGVFAAGELTGIGGATLAALEGSLAGIAAAVRATAIDESTVDKRARSLRRKVKRGRDFALALALAHPVRDGWHSWLEPDTLVCRCEEVTHHALREAVHDRGACGVRSLKLLCRVGLGACQGRVCGRNAAELAETALAETGTPSLIRSAALARRPLAAPIRLGDLAAEPEHLS